MADKKISELTNYTPPIDVDVVPIVDSTTGTTKKLTWANLKATIKTYYDSLVTTLTNKTINADNNTISNIGDEELKAGINANKISGGSVSNTEFDYINGVTSAIQTQLDNKEPKRGSDDNYVTDAEKTVIGNTSGVNTGDQDLSGLALKSNVLELDNTDAFTPDTDYEPATKKYVDDNAGGTPEGTAIKSTGETGATKFLREDGDGTCSWQNIPGGGDMLKSTYDTNANGKVDTSDALITHEADTNNPHSVIASQVNITDTDNNFNAIDTEDALTELAVKTDKSGFDRYNTDTMPDVAYDGATRTITASVKSGQSSFHFWVNNKQITKTTSQTVTIPDATGSYYIYFDDSGVLQYVLQNGMPETVFYKFAMVAFVYYNAENPTEYLFNLDELHGKDMSGITHESLHNTFGTQYSSGLEIEGLVAGNTTYTQSTSGVIFDEDIRHSLSANSSGHAFLYRDGTNGYWRKTSANLEVGLKESGDTYYSWNENTTGDTWALTEGTSSTDYWMTFFIATPQGVIKIMGQNAYSSVRKARNSIENEMNTLKTSGLPNPEFVFLGAVIVKRDGKLQAMADGSVFYNLKTSGRSSGGIGSSSTTYASDVPTDTTNFDNNLSSTDTDVQTALETLDDLNIPSTTADLPDSTNKRYITDAEKTVLDNTSGTNTGDQDLSTYATKTGTETLTNKRITPRVETVASASTITPTGNSSDLYTVTALAVNTTISAPSGTPTNGQKLMIRIKDDGTSRTLTWNAIYNVVGVTLPTSTTAGKTHYIGCVYNSANSKWDVLAVGTEA